VRGSDSGGGGGGVRGGDGCGGGDDEGAPPISGTRRGLAGGAGPRGCWAGCAVEASWAAKRSGLLGGLGGCSGLLGWRCSAGWIGWAG
jgi:hypothetical protein